MGQKNGHCCRIVTLTGVTVTDKTYNFEGQKFAKFRGILYSANLYLEICIIPAAGHLLQPKLISRKLLVRNLLNIVLVLVPVVLFLVDNW